MFRDIFVCLKLCLLIVICTANKWDLTDYRSSDEIAGFAAKHTNKKLSMSLGSSNGVEAKYDTKKLNTPTSEPGARDLKLWPEGRIPFYIDEFSYDKILRDKIREYLDHATTSTSLIFEELSIAPKDENERWVLIINRRGQLDCNDYSSESFTNSGVQKVILGYDCLHTRGPMAAIVLALAGVPPQHNAPERDNFIKVDMEAILPEKRALFIKLSPDNSRASILNSFPYDYGSVGHYPSYKYTISGSASITGIKPQNIKKSLGWTDIITEKDDYSPVDLEKIESLYKAIAVNKSHQGMQLEECKALYHPDSNISNVKKLNNLNRNPELKLINSRDTRWLASLSSLEYTGNKKRKH